MRGRSVAGLQVEEVAVKGAHEKQLEEGPDLRSGPLPIPAPLADRSALKVCAAANDGRSDPFGNTDNGPDPSPLLTARRGLYTLGGYLQEGV